ncbi:MAG: hypothetical protein ACRDFB_09695 [Rhabdochlamydiaceae bacterium]
MPLPIEAANLQLVSNTSTIGNDFKVGRSLFMQTKTENLSERPQDFTYITEVFDSSGAVTSIQWHNAHLTGFGQATLSNIWNPLKPDNYTINGFVWDNFTSAIPLSNSVNASIEVR